MDGILVINKEPNYTSRDVVNIVGKDLKTKKIGHTGTLDPMATGVLVLCIGKYTKLVEVLTSNDKEYEAEITLGLSTDTLDVTGNILDIKSSSPSKEEITNALNSMVGTYDQEVPIYSAVKINGKKLYQYARDNEEIDLPKHKVTIKSIELISDIVYKDNKTIFKIKTSVTKGTYIRSLVRDIALKLNTIGVMSSLNRTKQGIFDINNSYTLNDIQNNNYKFVKLEDALKNYKLVIVNNDLEKKISNGVQIPNTYNEEIILFESNTSPLALYKNDNGILKMWKSLK